MLIVEGVNAYGSSSWSLRSRAVFFYYFALPALCVAYSLVEGRPRYVLSSSPKGILLGYQGNPLYSCFFVHIFAFMQMIMARS